MKYLLASAVVMLTAVVVAFAREPVRQTDEDARRRDRVETVIIGKFADEMSLTPAEAEKFYPQLRQFRGDVDGIGNELAEVRRQLEEASGVPGGDQASVSRLLDQQDRLAKAMLDRKRQFLNDIGQFLSAQQVSRCSILLDELPRRIRALAEERQRGQPERRRGDPPRRWQQ